MATNGITVRGTMALKRNLARLGAQAPAKAAAALYQEAEERVAGPAKQIYVPVDLGNLRATIQTEPPEINGTSVTVAVRAGGPEAPYALIVHETPPKKARHKPPTSWKYLEIPLLEAEKGMGARLAKRLKDEGLLQL